MEQKLSKKIFHICMIILIIIAIFFTVGMLMLKYEVEGETNLPFKLTKITVISSTEGISTENNEVKWEYSVSQNNDIYMYIEKNDEYTKTEAIESIVLDNFIINREGTIGENVIYKPANESITIFDNKQENKSNSIKYTGELESNIKKLAISNQGGLAVFRYAETNLSTYSSNDLQEINHNQLLKLTNINLEDLKAKISFDITINLVSEKSYKATITLDVPNGDIIEQGTTSEEITNFENVIFKRV